MPAQNIPPQGAGYTPIYQIPMTEKRKYAIQVLPDRVMFFGKFLYLNDKNFVSNKGEPTVARTADFLGLGYLSMRSYKRVLQFVVSGVVLSLVNTFCDKVGELIEDANFFLSFIGTALSSDWLDILLKIATYICLGVGIMVFFSKKNVVEISFTTKRICVPKKSLSQAEYGGLYNVLKSLCARR